MQRHQKAYGYFWGDTWTGAAGKSVADEIALNPDHFRTRDLREVLATLVHEMCHLEQHHFGKPSRSGYHNKEWLGIVEAVGLVPSDTGEPGGKQTGQKVHHYIEAGGPFARASVALIKSGYTIAWHALTSTEEEETRMKKSASKTKYTCPASHDDVSVKGSIVLWGPRRALFRQTLSANLTSGGSKIPTAVPPAGLESSKGTSPLCVDGIMVPCRTTMTFPRSPARFAVAEQPDLAERQAAGFMIAPSGTTPSTTNRQRAIGSFRASATIITLRKRRAVCLVRSRNQTTCAAWAW